VAARLDTLGGALDEPVNLELVYVFAADEHATIADTEIAATILRDRRATFPACQ